MNWVYKIIEFYIDLAACNCGSVLVLLNYCVLAVV